MLGNLAIHGGLCSTCSFTSVHQVTPLLLATNEGYVDMVICLVDKGADINIQGFKGVSE